MKIKLQIKKKPDTKEIKLKIKNNTQKKLSGK